MTRNTPLAALLSFSPYQRAVLGCISQYIRCIAKYNRPPTSAIRESLTTKRGGYGQRRLFLKDGQYQSHHHHNSHMNSLFLQIKMLFIRAGTFLFGKIYNWLQICTDFFWQSLSQKTMHGTLNSGLRLKTTS